MHGFQKLVVTIFSGCDSTEYDTIRNGHQFRYTVENYIQKQFQPAIPLGEHDESQYYGPYNTPLTKLFPGKEHHMVVPQYERPRQWFPHSAAAASSIFCQSQGYRPYP